MKKISVSKSVRKHGFPIVAIGASSGGLEAITELLKYLSVDTGMAFIVIQHLSVDYKSILTSLLAKATKMKVQEIVGMEEMQPNNVYVIPNNKGIKVVNGHIQVIPRTKNKAVSISIDVLFTSLAETHKENAIGIILSGNASDGTAGLRAIKEQGGITFAQDNSAKFSGMPDSAFSEGVDFVLSPKEIARELNSLSKRSNKKWVLKATTKTGIDDRNTDLKIILQLLFKEKGVDFNYYKMPTVKRRILRRMFLYKLETYKQYIKLLKTNNAEIKILFDDLLINVTYFFRDEEVFHYLSATLFPKLIKSKTPNEIIRIWITACSTGQEAYSIAMILMELLGDKLSSNKIQIFATDLSDQVIKKARAGEYSKHEVSSISPNRLKRFFTKVDGYYKINKSVRELCSFATHNILTDPPFSRMDFISCRNMFIYLDSNIHKKVLTTFHYALKDTGYLMLGKSETIGSSPLFSEVSKKFKIFSRKKGIRSFPGPISRGTHPTNAQREVSPLKKNVISNPETTEKNIHSILFSKYIPAYVVINHSLEVIQFKGETSNYLEHSTGKASLNLLTMARPEIVFELRNGIHKAIETKQAVRKPDIEIKNDSIIYTVTLDIIPIENSGDEPLLLVVFTEQSQSELEKKGIKIKSTLSKRETINIKKLKEELGALRAELMTVNEDMEKTIKELQAANQEILSSNEEFQTMNEELETSKEEIESTNEELTTTNQELQTRNDQLLEAYNFSESIIATIHEPMLILDKDFTIKSANKSFYKIFRVNSEQIEGKPLFDIGSKQWDIKELRMMLNDILQKNLNFHDFEVTNNFPGIGQKIMLLNGQKIIQKTHRQQLILLAIEDITERAQSHQKEKELLNKDISTHKIDKVELERAVRRRTMELEQKNTELESLFQNASMGIILTDSAGEIIKINPHAEKKFGYQKDELIGKKIELLIPKRFTKQHESQRKEYNRNPQAREMGAQMDLFGLKKDGAEFPVEVSLSPYSTSKGHFVIAFIMDITERKQWEEEIRKSSKDLERSYQILEKSEENYRNLFENQLAPMLLTDMKTFKTLMVNNVGVELFGYKSKEDFLNNFKAFDHFVDPEERKRNIKLTKEKGELRSTVQEMKKLDGTHFWVKIYIKLNADRTVAHSIIIDITEQIKSQELLTAKVQELEKINKELETFTFISSHDLQEPLRKIQNFVNVLHEMEEKRLSPEGKSYLQKTSLAANRMRTLIEDLLEYARVKNNECKFEMTNLNDLIHQVLEFFKEDIEDKKAIIKIQGLRSLNIIQFQFRQLFQNLITNSLKFSDPKKQLCITIKGETKAGGKLNNVKLLRNKKYFHIAFSDNGMGFDPKYKDLIFEVFQRLNSVEKYKGTGIGLAICKRIVENHNGIMTATGKLNKGSRFDIYIPTV